MTDFMIMRCAARTWDGHQCTRTTKVPATIASLPAWFCWQHEVGKVHRPGAYSVHRVKHR